MQPVVTLTMNPALDKSSSVDQVIAERKLRCQPPRYEPGGGGINVSRAIRKLGGESTMIFPYGGATGDTLLKLLGQERLTCLPIPVEGSTRENLMILEENTGRQYRFGMPGMPLADEEWQRCLKALADSKEKPVYIVASGSLPPGVPEDFYAQVAKIGRDLGAKVVIDSSGEPLRHALQEGVYLIKPNIREMGELTGRESGNNFDPEKMAMELIRSGRSKVVALSLGAGGILFASTDGCEHLRTPVVPVKSKVGAGDSMVAGIVLSLTRGKSLPEAIRFGVAAGAAAVMTPGSELCRREDAERLYEQMSKGKE